ncbi:MAG: hypothetical protein ACJ71W_21975 [Terriglobales bacterium]
MIWHLDWVSCLISIAAIYFAGKRRWWAWLLYLVNLVFLVVINIKLHLWGFMPLNVFAAALYFKNAREWKRNG